jgi:hypothetical protein
MKSANCGLCPVFVFALSPQASVVSIGLPDAEYSTALFPSASVGLPDASPKLLESQLSQLSTFTTVPLFRARLIPNTAALSHPPYLVFVRWSA